MDFLLVSIGLSLVEAGHLPTRLVTMASRCIQCPVICNVYAVSMSQPCSTVKYLEVLFPDTSDVFHHASLQCAGKVNRLFSSFLLSLAMSGLHLVVLGVPPGEVFASDPFQDWTCCCHFLIVISLYFIILHCFSRYSLFLLAWSQLRYHAIEKNKHLTLPSNSGCRGTDLVAMVVVLLCSCGTSLLYLLLQCWLCLWSELRLLSLSES